MAEQVLAKSINDFFIRCGLSIDDKHECFSLLSRLYPGEVIKMAASQGYCSLTVLVGDDQVIQFRPPCYGLDLTITDTARVVYGRFAPATKSIGLVKASGLLVFSMDRTRGVSLSDFRESRGESGVPYEHLERLCKDFAIFLSKAWRCDREGRMRLGVVGKSIVPRLTMLSEQLPTRFRQVARRVLRRISGVQALSWVLTHGDITAGNMMIDPEDGSLCGLVDWAEAEVLPFGVSIYGLEEILGEMTSHGFRYHPDAAVLRDVFWLQLILQIPDLQKKDVLDAVKLARDIGVLLWHGIAFDDGAINRVVEEGRDLEEISRLDAFLDLGMQESVSENLPSKL